MAGMPRELERDAVSLRDLELAGHPSFANLDRRRRPQAKRVGARREQDPVRGLAHPRRGRPVAEARDEHHVDRHFALDALDDTHDVMRCRGRDGHKVDQPNDAAVARELGLENQRVGAIAPGRGANLLARMNHPRPVRVSTQKRRETGVGIEARQAEPIDGAVARNQGCALRVPEQRVVLEMGRHASPSL
jgi:hypothetical protein